MKQRIEGISAEALQNAAEQLWFKESIGETELGCIKNALIALLASGEVVIAKKPEAVEPMSGGADGRDTLINLLSTKVWGCGLATAPRVLNCLNEHGYEVVLRKDVQELVEAAHEAYSTMVEDGYGLTDEGIRLIEALAKFTTKQEGK